MTNHAHGTFEVKLIPQADSDPTENPVLGRLLIDKQFFGDLEGVSKGEMLSAMTTVEGSAGYVAIEQVKGTLQGRGGTFYLQHNGIMERGEGRLTISVIPDSGTGELSGLVGTMNIIIEDGKHKYTFDYTLP
jgi:hypothetical protein